MLRLARLRHSTKIGDTARGEIDEPIRLCPSNMSLISSMKDIRVPKYDRSKIRPGVVSLGLRDFHRVHQAVYFDSLLSIPSNSAWGIVSVAITDPQRKLFPEMKVQDSLYTVVSKRKEGMSDIRIVGSILDCMTTPDECAQVSGLISSKDTRIVTLTLKERNYFFTPDFSKLNNTDPHIHYDMLSSSVRPARTPVGMLVTGLYARFRKKGEPLTVLSCENLPRNGEIARVMVESFAVLRYPLDTAFHRWLGSSVFYPNTMCDRICLTDPSDDRISFQQRFGIRDNALLTTEDFSEWVIEKWMGDKPEGMKDNGIKLVASTVPYENLKIRLNYGTRLSVALVARTLGIARFEDAMKDPVIAAFAKRYMDEVTGGLGEVPADVNLAEYKKHVVDRMAVPDLKYMTQRVVEDASKKVRQDWQPVLENLASNATTPMIATAIAAWAHLLADSPLCKDRGFPLIDSSIADLEPIARELVANESDMESAARRFVTHIFGHNEKINSALGKQIVTSLKEMQKIGIRACVAKMSN